MTSAYVEACRRLLLAVFFFVVFLCLLLMYFWLLSFLAVSSFLKAQIFNRNSQIEPRIPHS